jgi:hypothetical protein
MEIRPVGAELFRADGRAGRKAGKDDEENVLEKATYIKEF